MSNKAGIAIFIIVILSGLGFVYYEQTSVCRNPLAYDIGGFDANFGISRDRFLDAIKEAEAIWERDTGQNLFNYETGADFKINLIFDERQQLTISGNQSKGEIQGSRQSYDSLLNQYKSLEASYKLSLSAYNSQVLGFEQRLSAYNARVAEVNKKGGATPQEYQELEKEQKYLEAEKARLDDLRLALNATASRLNSLGDQVNELAQKLNIEVDIHNERFGKAREFDQGDYLGNRINIYQFDGMSDLRLVLAHELGHALGISHVENPVSIMYYLMEKQSLNNPELSPEDLEAFKTRCEFRIPKLQELFN